MPEAKPHDAATPKGKSIQSHRFRHRSSRRASRLIFACVQRQLRENPCVHQAEEIPLGARLGFEVPKHPSVRHLLVNFNLRFDVLPRVIFERLVPSVDEIDGIARADPRRIRLIAVVLGADAVAIERSSAVRHGGRPFADDNIVIDV